MVMKWLRWLSVMLVVVPTLQPLDATIHIRSLHGEDVFLSPINLT